MYLGPSASASIPARRLAIVGIASALTAVPPSRSQVQQPYTEQEPSSSVNQARTSIHYEIEFRSSPQRLYETLLDPKQFGAFSGLPAIIDSSPGGAFSQFGGQIVGRNVELVPCYRIVQAWRPAHWDPGIYSIAHFEFHPRFGESTLVFDHTGFVAGEYDALDWGWHRHYWGPLKRYFA